MHKPLLACTPKIQRTCRKLGRVSVYYIYIHTTYVSFYSLPAALANTTTVQLTTATAVSLFAKMVDKNTIFGMSLSVLFFKKRLI